MALRLQRWPKAMRHTLLYGCSIALMKGMSLLLLPFIAHYLSPEEFGRLEVISSLAVIGSILVGLGLEEALYRFAGSESDEAKKKRVVSQIFGFSLVVAAIALVLGYVTASLVARYLPGSATSYEITLVLSVFALEGVIAVPLGWLRMRDKAISFFWLTTGRALVQASLIFILVSAQRGVAGVLEAGFIAAIVQMLFLTYLQIKDTGLSFSISQAKNTLVYTLPIVGSGLLAFALNGLDRWLLADLTSLSDVAAFGVAAKFALAVVLLLQPFGMWWLPKRFDVLNSDNGQEKASRYIAIGISLCLIITVLVGLLSPLVIHYLLPEDYALAGQYVLGLVLVMALKEIAELINLGCFTGKTTHTQFIINLVAALSAFACMQWWIPEYGVWGCIVALILAQAIRVFAFFIASQHFLPLPYPNKALFNLITLSLIWLLVGFDPLHSSYQILLCAVAMVSLLAFAIRSRLLPPVSEVFPS